MVSEIMTSTEGHQKVGFVCLASMGDNQVLFAYQAGETTRRFCCLQVRQSYCFVCLASKGDNQVLFAYLAGKTIRRFCCLQGRQFGFVYYLADFTIMFC